MSRDVKFLSREIAPFGASLGIRSVGAAIVDNPDTVLTYLAYNGYDAYRGMLRAESAISTAFLKRRSALMAEGFDVVLGGSGSKNARKNKDFAIALLKNIPNFNSALMASWDAIKFGFMPLEIFFRFDWKWKKKQCWGVSKIAKRRPDDFKFTSDGDLVFVGGLSGKDYVYFNDPIKRMKFLTCTYMGAETPYGEAECSYVWLLYYIKQRFIEMMASGMAKALGIMRHTRENSIPDLSTDLARKSDDDIKAEIASALQLANEKNIIIDMPGGKTDWLNNVVFTDGWKAPIEYCDHLITMRIQGEELSSSNNGVSNRASAETGLKNLQTMAREDSLFVSEWWSEFLKKFIEINFGEQDPDDLPKFKSRLSTRIDLNAAKILFDMGAPLDGVSLAASSGVKLAQDDSIEGLILKKQEKLSVGIMPQDPTNSGKPESIPTADGDTNPQVKDRMSR